MAATSASAVPSSSEAIGWAPSSAYSENPRAHEFPLLAFHPAHGWAVAERLESDNRLRIRRSGMSNVWDEGDKARLYDLVIPLPVGKLRWFITQLAAIDHVDVIRLGTRVPVTLPQRLLDTELIEFLQSVGKIWIQTHFNHPREITPETARAVRNLVNAGMPVSNHAVLLRGGRVVAAGPADTVLTAPLIAEAYGVEVEIGVTPAGQRFILPIAR